MIKWHLQDTVSAKEIDRNNAAFSYQGNRNPYVDSPQFVMRVWNNICPNVNTLPITITSFTGRLVGDQIKLEWIAQNELNFDRFEVERSFNGTTYCIIGQVKANNNFTYNFYDNADALSGRRVYYRLKKVDKDGSFKYSSVFTIHIPLNTKFSIYPNPANTYIQLQFNKNVNGKVGVQLTDVTGKIIQQQSLNVNGSTLRLNTEKFSAGTYVVKMDYRGEQYFQKVLIVK